MTKQCSRAAGASPCAMCGHSPMTDYGLAAPIVPTQLSPSLKLPPPRARRSNFVRAVLNFDPGHFSPPFEPPRA